MSGITVSQLLNDLDNQITAATLPDLRVDDGWRTRSEWKDELHVGYNRLMRLIKAAEDYGLLEKAHTYRTRSDGVPHRVEVLRFKKPGDTA
jgi:hypothetical protein